MLLINNVTAVTVDAQRRIITDAAIAVEGGRIADIGKASELILGIRVLSASTAMGCWHCRG